MRSRGRLLEASAVILIVALAAYLRYANLRDNPAWYTDEGTHLDIARHLITGRVQYLAIDDSLLLFSRLPLFEGLLALAVRLWGVDILTLRSLTAALGTFTVLTMFVVVRRITRESQPALWAALLLAISPPAVLYSRFGFSYNLLPPLMLIALWGLIDYSRAVSRKRYLAVAACSIGLGALADLWMLVLIAPLALIVIVRRRRDLAWSAPLAVLPLGSYLLIGWAAQPQAVSFDLNFVFSRINQLSIAQQIETLWQNVMTLSAQEAWFVIGFSGLALLPSRSFRGIALAFAAMPFVLLARTTALFNLSAYYLIPLWPLLALGVAGAIWRVAALGFVGRVIAIGLAGLIGLSTVPPLIDQIQTRFRTEIDPFLIDASAARAVAAFVNARVDRGDLVMASPGVAWLIESQVADMQMPTAYGGLATPHLPANVPGDRWVFDPSYERARFVIVDNLWRNWAVPNVPGVRAMLSEVGMWPLALKTGEIEVYANPRWFESSGLYGSKRFVGGPDRRVDLGVAVRQ